MIKKIIRLVELHLHSVDFNANFGLVKISNVLVSNRLKERVLEGSDDPMVVIALLSTKGEGVSAGANSGVVFGDFDLPKTYCR